MLSLPVPAACVCLSVQAKVPVCRTSSLASVESAFHSPCTVMVQSTAAMAPMKLTAEVSVCRRSPECASTVHTITLLQVTLLHWVYWVLLVCLQYTVYIVLHLRTISPCQSWGYNNVQPIQMAIVIRYFGI